MVAEMIQFQVDTKRIIEVLAKQIYQSPLALLRENTQNAYDAILMRKLLGSDFEPSIIINVYPDAISVSDNGIGMTIEEMKLHFWRAGSSSKNTEAAKKAGVVGTFGIGAMANFGIADKLVVETESAVTGKRIQCTALLEDLKFNQDCIQTVELDSLGTPGTTVTARLAEGVSVDVGKAQQYVQDFVALLSMDVSVNGTLVSRQPIDRFLARFSPVWQGEEQGKNLGGRLYADVVMAVSQNADVWIELENLAWMGQPLEGKVVFRSGNPVIHSFRNGFGLATVSVGSAYQFGGVADILVFQPTAGREALTTDSMQILQNIVTAIDNYVSEVFGTRPESDSSTPFMSWAAGHKRFDLCRSLKVSISPGERTTLADIEMISKTHQLPVYGGSDPDIIKSYSNEERPLLLLAKTNPRRQCELGYLKAFCNVADVADAPQITHEIAPSGLTPEQNAFAFRIESVLETDYFLRAVVKYAKISHGLTLLVQPEDSMTYIYLSPDGSTVKTILGLYEHEYGAFGSIVKDFVRTAIFPKIADRVPSSTRQGAEAFLRAINKPREVFEYEQDDAWNLTEIWTDYTEGKISLVEAVSRSKETVTNSVQIVDEHAAAQINDVVPDVISNEQTISAVVDGNGPDLSTEAAPAILRTDKSSRAKIILIGDDLPALRGFRCFIALSEKARADRGDFFMQPHTTSIVWGGQKVLFIFLHHSRQFGLYYDLQTRQTVNPDSGGKAFPTSTIVLKDQIYIPVPDEIKDSFIPRAGEKKRFEVRCDLLRAGEK